MDVLLQKDDHLLVERGKGVSRLEVIEGPTGRRRWPDDVKARLVAESFQEGVRVCDVARRNGLNLQHLGTWRKMARDGKLALNLDDGPAFAAFVVDGGSACAPADTRPAPVVLGMCTFIAVSFLNLF